jgi:hypothetical protein
MTILQGEQCEKESRRTTGMGVYSSSPHPRSLLVKEYLFDCISAFINNQQGIKEIFPPTRYGSFPVFSESNPAMLFQIAWLQRAETRLCVPLPFALLPRKMVIAAGRSLRWSSTMTKPDIHQKWKTDEDAPLPYVDYSHCITTIFQHPANVLLENT